jgi:phosphoribosyl-AMP cyclohydrolase / phosphoribosyl-ATP pyrophosphohydrolase
MNIDFSKGLVPAIVRDATTGAVLTLAWMNEESLQRTIDTGETWFWSRSRNELWHKGATSGNTQHVLNIATDCDRDALVVTVEASGPACHTGAFSCFADVPPPAFELDSLMAVLRSRRAERPEGSYTAGLFDAGLHKILKKIGEEATEVVIAAGGETRDRLVSEVADLVFHLSVLLVEKGVDWGEIGSELRRRR